MALDAGSNLNLKKNLRKKIGKIRYVIFSSNYVISRHSKLTTEKRFQRFLAPSIIKRYDYTITAYPSLSDKVPPILAQSLMHQLKNNCDKHRIWRWKLLLTKLYQGRKVGSYYI